MATITRVPVVGDLGGGPGTRTFSYQTVTTTATLPAGTGPRFVAASSAGGAYAITLPKASSVAAGCEIVLRKTTTDTNTITVALNGADTIGSVAAPGFLFSKGDLLGLVSDGISNWSIAEIQASPVKFTVSNAAWAIPAGWTAYWAEGSAGGSGGAGGGSAALNGRSVADAVTNSTPTVTSATAAFVAADLFKAVSGTNIPVPAYIGIINSGTSVGLSSSPIANVPVNATGAGVAGTLQLSGIPNQAGGGGGGAGAAGKVLATAQVPGATIAIVVGAGGALGAGGIASVDTNGHGGTGGSAGGATTVTGTGIALSLDGAARGGAGGLANSNASQVGGQYGKGPSTSSFVSFGCGGGSGIAGNSGSGISGGGGGGGGTATAANGGGAGTAGGAGTTAGGAGGAGTSGTAAGGDGVAAAANSGAGGPGGGGGAPGAKGGDGGNGGSGIVILTLAVQ